MAIPAFIVTLGGLLVWRNVAWYLTNGQTIGPLDNTFLKFGGNERNSGHRRVLGGRRACDGTCHFSPCSTPAEKNPRMNFRLKPLWAEVALSIIISVGILGLIWILNSYQIPQRRLERIFEARGGDSARRLDDGVRIANFGANPDCRCDRHDHYREKNAIWPIYFRHRRENPDAAELSGINTRMLTVKVFALMGALCALSAVVASARLANHTNDIGTLDELRGDRGRGYRRNGALRRSWHHSWCDTRRVDHAVAPIGNGHGWR